MKEKQNLKVCLVSLGCAKNLVDSEKMLATLGEAGCVVAAPMDEADVILINTCSFISAARDESLEIIEEAVEQKRTGRARRVVVAGCLPSRDGADLYQQVPGIDAVVGVNNRRHIAAAVMGKRRLTRIDPACRVPDDRGRFRLTPRHTAYLRIAEGCSRRCSYCTIPAIRGPFRSKQPKMVLAEARELIADGAVELNVIAQDTTSYGQDLAGSENLPKLVRQLDSLDGVKWIRLMYTYPQRFTDELVEVFGECDHVVPYVDIPLQHISDLILRRMGRGVKRKDIESLLRILRGIRNTAGAMVLRTTLMVGFPGEADRQFAELLEFVEEFKFDALGVFEFSAEPGTAAAKMPNQVSEAVKADRAEQIMLRQHKIASDANKEAIGRRLSILIDGEDSSGRCVGRYYGQAPGVDSVCVLTSRRQPGEFAEAQVVGYDDYDLIAAIDD